MDAARSAEIEAKRAKIEQMRRQRQERERQRSSTSTPQPPRPPLSSVVAIVASAPKSVRYSKSTQTDAPKVVYNPPLPAQSTPLPAPVVAEPEPVVEDVPDTDTSNRDPEFAIEENVDISKLTLFMENALRIVERCTENPDVLVDYSAHSDDQTEAAANIHSICRVQGSSLNVTSIDWSPFHRNLVACAYGNSNSITSVGGSTVLVWSLDFPSAPEYTLKASTDIIFVRFSRSSPSIVYGGGYNGQIISWDLRTGRNIISSARSATDGSGHLLPICALEASPSINHDVLVSCSIDGVVCTWPSDRLTRPEARIALLVPGKSTAIAATCLCLWQGDSSIFLVGTVNGTIYSGCRVDSVGAKAGISASIVYTGHTAPVTSIKYHPSRSDQVFMSSSLDWSVCVWRTAPTSVPPATTTIEPILDIQLSDAVTDIAWDPHHSAVLALACRNQLQIWNFSQHCDEPVAVFSTEEMITSVEWDSTIKTRLMIGTMRGLAQVLSIDASILEGVYEF